MTESNGYVEATVIKHSGKSHICVNFDEILGTRYMNLGLARLNSMIVDHEPYLERPNAQTVLKLDRVRLRENIEELLDRRQDDSFVDLAMQEVIRKNGNGINHHK